MIARLVIAYLAIFAVILGALSFGAYVFAGSQYHSLLLPALSTPEGARVYAATMQRVARTIVSFDVPLLLLVGCASWILARISIAPWTSAREREREFIANAAHELRSPLASIASLAQASRHTDEDQMRRAFERITATALDASELVTDLLTLARHPSKALLQREPVDLAALAVDCVRELAPRAQTRGVALSTSVESSIVNGDERRIRELIRNLLENALSHAASTITLTCRTEGASVMLCVADDGPGVPESVRERLFERFVRAGEGGGTGLGLAIAQWVARAHEGRISLDRTPAGASFTVTIPRLEIAEG